MNRFAYTAVLCAFLAPPAWGINGSDLSLNSGTDAATSALLNNNAYAGTYITLDQAGPVMVTINAQGSSFGGVDPHLNLVVNDTSMGWDVGAAAANYEHTLNLPAGTHFIRAEFNNDGGTSRSLTINSLDIDDGATLETTNTNALALAAADTYIANYRQGAAKLALVGVAPGAQVDVKLKRHAFNFGVGIPNSYTDTFLVPPDSPGADSSAAQFQQALVDNRINSLTPGNAGKWGHTEDTRDVITTKQPPAYAAPYVYMDRIAQYAADHNMGYRAHNLIWGPNNSGGNNQQPGWAHTMLQNPTSLDAVSGDVNSVALRDEISERIDYNVEDRAHQFYEIDVYNESYHTGSNHSNSALTYWEQYGASGIASIYKEVKEAIAAAGADAGVFVNEYSVVQQQGGDYYANWYMRHIDDLQNAGKALYGADENVVTGVGFQYYASTNLASHVPARIYADVHNLAVHGLPISLTEWGVGANDNDIGNATKEANAAIILNETARLMFGMPSVTGMTLWELRTTGAFAPIGALYDTSSPTWAIRDAGIAWQELQSEWDTQLMDLVVGPDGTIDFSGFYGDYEITVDGQTHDLVLAKGDTAYSLVVAAGDYNADGIVDAADYTVWRDTLGSVADLRADGNGNEVIDAGDYDVWKSLFGTSYGSGAAAAVPERASIVLLAAASVFLLAGRRKKSKSAP